MVRVIKAKKTVTIVLTAEHVQKSIDVNGVGNTAKCSAAICTYAHKGAFPHPVVGYTDWTYTRAFIASKLDRIGLPDDCYAYEHADEIARLNDSKNGQRKLLAFIKQHGPITITLRPYRQRSEEGRPGRNRIGTGIRKKRIGANLRFFSAIQGGALPVITLPAANVTEERASP